MGAISHFFTPLRQSIKNYAAGVHLVGEPASASALQASEKALGMALPAVFREFLKQWNGASLFHETVIIYGVEGTITGPVQRHDGGLVFGEIEQSTLLLDAAGRVIALDAATDPSVVVGSTFDGWLAAVVARESMLLDREGEFREEVFEEGCLRERVIERRARAGIKADAAAPAWHFELGCCLAEKGHTEEAISAVAQAIALDSKYSEAISFWAELKATTTRAHFKIIS